MENLLIPDFPMAPGGRPGSGGASDAARTRDARVGGIANSEDPMETLGEIRHFR